MSTTTDLESSDREISTRAKWLIAVLTIAGIAAALIITSLREAPIPGSTDFTFDPNFGVPTPPHSTPYEHTNNIIATVALTLIGLTGVVLGVRDLRKKKTLLPLAIALSGALICLPEVFFDIMGAVYFPWSESNHAYTILGREMPWWIVTGWFGYGSFNYFTFRVLLTNPRTKSIWLMWGAAMVGDIIFEEVLLNLGVYHYYGNQPLVILTQFPWWWIPCNSVGVFLAASIAYRFRHEMHSWKALGMLVITPMSVGCVYGFVALPSWIAVNANYPWLVTQILGMVTLVFGVLLFSLILVFVHRRPPFRPDYRPLPVVEAPIPLTTSASSLPREDEQRVA